MKANICKLLLFTHLLLLLFPFATHGQDSGVDVRIKRVEQGLLPSNGDTELEIANFKKSLEMNPKNTHGAEMLKKLTTQ